MSIDPPETPSPAPPVVPAWHGYAWAVAGVAIAWALSMGLRHALDPVNLIMPFLLAVVATAYRQGRGPAVLSAVLGVAAFDFFLVPPYLSFAVADAQYLITFAAMLATGLAITELAARLRRAAVAAQGREQRARDFYELARTLSAAPAADAVEAAASDYFQRCHAAAAALLVPGTGDRLESAAGQPIPWPGFDRNVARAVFGLGRAQDMTRPSQATIETGGLFYRPLRAPSGMRGVLVVQSGARLPLGMSPEQDLATAAELIAMALERIHLQDLAHGATLTLHSERLRSTLLSALSHDLRTPLTAILGSAESLRLASRGLDAERLALVEGIAGEARRTSDLVENILDMARLESGAMTLRKEWHALEEIAGAAIAARAALLGGRRVQVEIPDTLPLVACDALAIERVFVNLIENAARHTGNAGTVTIGATVADHQFTVRVMDDGPGIAPGMESAIFEKFVRGPEAAAGTGLGLGLAISRAIVEAHGGALSAANGPVGGAVFTFTLPAMPGPEPGAQPDEAP